MAQAGQSYAPSFTDAAAQAIAKSVPAKSEVKLACVSLSPLGAEDVAGICADISAGLRQRGMRVVTTQTSDTEVRVTISQAQDGLEWIAQIHRSDSDTVRIGSIAAGDSSLKFFAPVANVLLHAQKVFGERSEFYDFAIVSGTVAASRTAYVLERDRLAQYDVTDTGWRFKGFTAIRGVPQVRDLRGHIVMDQQNPEIYLSSTKCTQSGCDPEAGSKWTLGQWSLGFARSRNYFSTFGNAASPMGEPSLSDFPFYSVASPTSLRADAPTPAVAAGVNETTRLVGGNLTAPKTITGWGDEIATVNPDGQCGGRWHVLAAGTGDWTQPDELRGYAIWGDLVELSGDPVELPGPILALWPSDDGTYVRAVVHNLQTGNYEAYVVTASCSQ
jgi:hypothetical protein